jgi:hypothetical protein
MPFTLAHPAIVTPLRKRGFPLSALVAGSMAPDIGFYFSLGPMGDRAHHTFSDVFTFCVPAGLLALWMFHRVLKQPLLGLMPLPLQSRLQPYVQPFSFGPCRRLLIVTASLIVGALLHLAWDFFCHTPGWSGLPLAFLTATVIPSGLIGNIRVVEVLHVLFSIVGLTFLAFQTGRALLPASPHTHVVPAHATAPRANPGLLGIALLIALAMAAFLAATAGSLFLTQPLSDALDRRLAIYRTVVLTVTFFFGELLVISLALMARSRVAMVLNRRLASCGQSAFRSMAAILVSTIAGPVSETNPTTRKTEEGEAKP